MDNLHDTQKKILIITVSMKASGVSIVCQNLAYALKKKGHNVSLLSLSDSASPQQLTSLKKNIAYHATPNKYFSLSKTPTIIYSLSRYFKQNKQFDIISIAGIVPSIFCLFSLGLVRHKAKIIVNFHTNLSSYFKSQNKIKAGLIKAIFKTIKKQSTLANVSKGASIDAQNILNSPVHCLYNPACTDTDLTYSSNDAPHPWLENKALTTFITCGRLCQEKNFSFLLQSFAILSKKMPQARLLIMGDGDLKTTLQLEAGKQEISQKVDFLGTITKPQEYMYHADFFWLTSKFEGFSMALAEALSMGVNCISIDCPYGPKEILKDGQYGLLLPYQITAEDMAREVLLYIKKPLQGKAFYRERAADFTDTKAALHFLDLMNKPK